MPVIAKWDEDILRRKNLDDLPKFTPQGKSIILQLGFWQTEEVQVVFRDSQYSHGCNGFPHTDLSKVRRDLIPAGNNRSRGFHSICGIDNMNSILKRKPGDQPATGKSFVIHMWCDDHNYA